VVADLLLFGVPGIIIIAIQMTAMPVFAAGVINGLGHFTGYRNFECNDASTNIVPWGLLIGGEELHNNHHAFPTSAKFSVRRWEFDIGWLYIRIFSFLRVVKINRVAPRPVVDRQPNSHLDIETLTAIVVNRMHVLRDYTRQVTLPVFRMERALAKERDLFKRAKKLLVRHTSMLDAKSSHRLRDLLAGNAALRTVHDYREKLSAIWSSRNVSNEKLLDQLCQWCQEAEASGIQALEDFADRLRSYQLAPA